MIELTKEDILQGGDECLLADSYSEKPGVWALVRPWWIGGTAGALMEFVPCRCRRPELSDKKVSDA